MMFGEFMIIRKFIMINLLMAIGFIINSPVKFNIDLGLIATPEVVCSGHIHGHLAAKESFDRNIIIAGFNTVKSVEANPAITPDIAPSLDSIVFHSGQNSRVGPAGGRTFGIPIDPTMMPVAASGAFTDGDIGWWSFWSDYSEYHRTRLARPKSEMPESKWLII